MKRKEMRGKCCICGAEGRFIQVLVGKAEGRRQFKRHRRRWKCNAKKS